MTKQYLLEIGLEEVPARFLLSLSQQLKERVELFLNENRLEFGQVLAYATPRRLAIIIDNLAESQSDYTESAKGPAMKIAKDQDGNWTKAAQGFFKGQSAVPEDAYVEEIKGVDYLHIKKFVQGKMANEILSNIVDVISSMSFPVTMHWNTVETPYIRPIHWFVSLLDNELVPFEFVGIKADRLSKGHRFLGHDVIIESPATYVSQLKNEFVIVDFEERQATIRQQIIQIATENEWVVPIDDELLEEVTSIVEWPTVFYGEFEQAYLKVPQQVLITAMRDHQRYFYAMDQENQLLPIFISARNGNAAHIENVIKGNKKVLKARLEDALFFYEEDLNHELGFYLEKLKNVNEHFKLGSLADKQRRVADLIPELTQYIHVEPSIIQAAIEAAKIYKYDLMTQIVGEFDELQGEIGYVYANHFGIDEPVAMAIREQYLPKTSGGGLPSTDASRLLTLADKLDTLINYFNVGLIPTGSNDPYALRRQAMGVVEILLATDWQIDLYDLLSVHPEVQNNDALLGALVDFFKARMSVELEREAIDFDIIQAVVASKGLAFKQMLSTAQSLQSLKMTNPETYRQMVESISRVVNLGDKEATVQISTDLAQTDSEKTLLAMVESLGLGNIIATLQQLVNPIQRYFEENMVNDENEEVRNNRYSTMAKITQYVLEYFDPSVLISKF